MIIFLRFIKNLSFWKIKFVFLLVAILFIIILVAQKASLNLDELAVVTGRVVDTEIIMDKNARGKESPVYVLTLHSTKLKFGLGYNNSVLLEYFKQNNPMGKKMKIYYDPDGKYDADNLTLHVWQVEMEGEVLLDLEDAKLLHEVALMMFVPLFYIILLLFLYLIFREKRKLEEAQSR